MIALTNGADKEVISVNFSFRQMKPLIQREFDEILVHYPTDLSGITDKVPVGGDPYERKRILMEGAAEGCPVHLFPHYPFACELDIGGLRNLCYIGIGEECYNRSGVDFQPLRDFRTLLLSNALGSFNDYTDYIHRTLDHDRLLSVGFKGVYEECARLNEDEQDDKKRRWRELVMACCLCVRRIGLRFREAAIARLPDAADEDERYNLNRIIHSANVPWEPAGTLFEVLTSFMRTGLIISGLDGVQMEAFGQLDRLLDPFYRKDLADGRMTEEEAYFLLQCFLHRTDMHCHYNEQRKDYDHGVTIMIGGCGPDGVQVYNRVTDLIIRAYAEERLLNPKLNARASAESPRAYIDALVSLLQTGCNNLVVMNDDYIIPMFMRMGLSVEDARSYVGNGCQEAICRNQLHSRAFTYLSLPGVLLDTLRGAREQLPEKIMPLYRYGRFDVGNFDELMKSFLANLRSLIRSVAEMFVPYEAIHHRINPEPLLSAFTADCIASGRDLSDGGARYNHKTFSLFGFGTLCDSLLSLRRAFSAGTQENLLEAVAADFKGYERLRQELASSPDRFGHTDSADRFAKELANELAEVSRGIMNARGVEWRTSLFTYYLFNSLGIRTGATPDGRAAGEPFSRQMNMAKLPDLTAAALSMACLTEADFNDVGMFDFALPFSGIEGEQARAAFADFIRTCLELKLPVLQPNVVSVRQLREEKEHPGTHPGLVVRVCGYSAPFNGLSDRIQEEIIRRAEQ